MKKLTLFFLLASAPIWALAGAMIEVEAAALYWRPCTPSRPYALIGTQGQIGTVAKVAAIEPDFNWGVRVGAEYTNTNCNLFAGFHATRLWAVNRGRLEGGQFVAVLTPGGVLAAQSIKAVLDIDYYTIDVRGGHTWACIPRLKADLYILGRYAFLRRRENGTARSLPAGMELIDTLKMNSRFKGGGFGLGFGSRYDLWCGLRLRSDLVIGALYGEQLYTAFSQASVVGMGSTSRKIRDTHCGCLPFFDVRAVLEYSHCFCDFLVVAAQLGWEYNGYPGAIPVPGETSLEVGITRQHIGFGGPFVNVALRF